VPDQRCPTAPLAGIHLCSRGYVHNGPGGAT
jgi:hypothetical protein